MRRLNLEELQAGMSELVSRMKAHLSAPKFLWNNHLVATPPMKLPTNGRFLLGSSSRLSSRPLRCLLNLYYFSDYKSEQSFAQYFLSALAQITFPLLRGCVGRSSSDEVIVYTVVGQLTQIALLLDEYE